MMQKPPQELSSTYFNPIINKSSKPITIDELDAEQVARFERAIESAFPLDAEDVKVRLKYLIPYILNSIDWDIYKMPLEGWQLNYYYQRERFLEHTGLNFEAFDNHKLLRKAVEDLGLLAEPTFEFILFLKYYYSLRSELRHSPIEVVSQINNALAANPAAASMDVKINGKHFKIENAEFIKALFGNVDLKAISAMRFKDDFTEGSNRDKLRALDYYLVKTLLDYLPVKVTNRKGKYTQAERNFALCVLNFCGRLNGDDIEGICSHENNVTFDKLMRDFDGAPIPFAMELFL